MRTKEEINKRIWEYRNIVLGLQQQNKPNKKKIYLYINLINILDWVLYGED